METILSAFKAPQLKGSIHGSLQGVNYFDESLPFFFHNLFKKQSNVPLISNTYTVLKIKVKFYKNQSFLLYFSLPDDFRLLFEILTPNSGINSQKHFAWKLFNVCYQGQNKDLLHFDHLFSVVSERNLIFPFICEISNLQRANKQQLQNVTPVKY